MSTFIFLIVIMGITIGFLAVIYKVSEGLNNQLRTLKNENLKLETLNHELVKKAETQSETIVFLKNKIETLHQENLRLKTGVDV